MNDRKMIRVAKNLDIFVNVGGKITAGMGIACLLIAALVLAFGGRMFTEGSITLDLDFIKFHLADNSYVNERFIRLYVCVATLGGGIYCFLIYHVSGLLRRILTPMKIGRPFETGISENLKKVGWLVLIGGSLGELLGIAARLLLTKAYTLQDLFVSPAITRTEFVFTMNFSFVMIACVIFFLSYIFTYGQTLQQDSDETL